MPKMVFLKCFLCFPKFKIFIFLMKITKISCVRNLKNHWAAGLGQLNNLIINFYKLAIKLINLNITN